MKKFLVAMMVVTMTVSGCSFLQTTQDTFCNPPADVIAVANAAAPLVAVAISIAVPGSAVYVNAVSVMAAITAIQGGACVSLTQLNTLIAWIQSDEAKSIQTKALIKVIAPISAQPLLDWRDSVK